MKSNKGVRKRYRLDQAFEAMERMDEYCAARPKSPAALRRPRLLVRGHLWIALLGPSVEEGIVGIGTSVEGALRAFDSQYTAGMRPSAQILGRRALRNSTLSAA